jgi:predicted nucleotidyltransferase component of viral defense system
MSSDRPKNVAASVHARLKNLGRESKRDFNLLLVRYALERFLVRLSRSKYHDDFVLKGALVFVAWGNAIERPTRDLDLLTFADPDVGNLEKVFCEICGVDVEPDGLLFDSSTVRGSVIREGAIHDGVRMKFTARLGNARNQLQVDVGFGDAVVPPPSLLDFPVLLDQDPPRILAYPPEAVVAEKFHAMMSLGMTNSRLKDYYDIWRMLETIQFDSSRVAAAVTATFKRRGTKISADEPDGLSRKFADLRTDAWAQLSRRFELEDDLPPLEDVIQRIREFLMPVIEAVENGVSLDKRWAAETGWQGFEEGN